jgi:hypothetical protein
MVESTTRAMEQKKENGELTKRAEAVFKAVTGILDTADAKEITAKFSAFNKLLGENAQVLDAQGKVTSFGRNLFKYPFMIFLYGAGSNRIKKELSGVLIAEAIKNILRNPEVSDDSIIEALSVVKYEDGEFTLNDLRSLRSDLQNKNYSEIDVKGVKLSAIFDVMFGELYGNAVTGVMEAEFTGVIEVNKGINAVTRVMMRMYLAAFDSLTKGKINISKNQEAEVFRKLSKMFPMIKHPFGKDRTVDGIAVFDTTKLGDNEQEYGKAYTSLKAKDENGNDIKDKDGNYVEKKVGVTAVRRKLVEAISGGAVGITHNFDGALVGVLGMTHRLLMIHDAMTLGGGQIDAIGDYHKWMLVINQNWNQVDSLLIALAEAIEFKDGDIDGGKLYRDVVRKDAEAAGKAFEDAIAPGKTVGDVVLDLISARTEMK